MAASITPINVLENNTVRLSVSGNTKRIEGIVVGPSILPGTLLELSDLIVEEDSSVERYLLHSTAGGYVPPIFAMENIYGGETMYQEYDAGEKMQIIHCKSGDRILAIVEPIGVGLQRAQFWQSDGNGQLQIAVPGNYIVTANLYPIDITVESTLQAMVVL